MLQIHSDIGERFSQTDLLLPMQPRLYSIASSPAEMDDEVHLTVSALRYQAHGRDHLGGASGFIAERLTVMLHLVNSVQPGIPVVLVDTGHLFAELHLFNRFDAPLPCCGIGGRIIDATHDR